MAFLDEAQVELGLLDMLKGMGYEYAYGPEIAPDGERPERATYDQVVLLERLRMALGRINPEIPSDAIEEAVRKVTRTESPSPVENNRRFHGMLTEGVDVEFANKEGRIVHDKVWLVDFDDAGNNEFLAVNQFTVIEKSNRRPDVVIFINGLPIGVIELKNPADEDATIRKAYKQLQTYKQEIPGLFVFNELLAVSDGLKARAGTLTGGWEWFLPWRTIEGKTVAPKEMPQLQVLIRGMFDKSRLLDLMRHFIVFDTGGREIAKKLAGYHQFHVVQKAMECTVKASSPEGDRRIGVVWHTQGSGKSLSMIFFAGKIIRHPAMENPTLVVITDRNDLDGQLFDNFAACWEVLRQKPERAASRRDLQQLLRRASGGVIFTTIQKFFPETKRKTFPMLSDRSNIVVIADEAHRSQYGFIEGFARHIRDALPKASFIGFTGTPIERGDRSTPAVFGSYIDVYDIERAVEDEATVRIYYEGRLAQIELDEAAEPRIDPDFEEVTEGEEVEAKEKLKSRWARLEAVVGTEKRIGMVAEDLVDHFEQRLEAMEGKALIVCMSRRVCIDIYNAIVKLRPDWHDDADDKGVLKVVMTGSATDPVDWQGHIRNKERRGKLADRFKDDRDPFKMGIVRDMWLTGFDCPCMHTMYLDKPMRGHGLMQAIARVNRVYKDKPGGLIVDYLGLAPQLKDALADYTESGGTGEATLDQAQAVAVMKEKCAVVRGMMQGYDYPSVVKGPRAGRMAGVLAAMEHVLAQADGKTGFLKAATELSKAFALAVPHEEAIAIRDEVGFFQAVRAGIAKTTATGGESEEELNTAVRQIVSRAVTSDEVVDLFSAVGLKKPDISILSDEFLAEVRGMPHRNLAVEALQKLLRDEIKVRSRKNLVQARSFAGMLTESVNRYRNRAIEAAQVIEELIQLAKDMREAGRRGEDLGLAEDEVAFYDALETNDSAVKVLGDETLKTIARELVKGVRRNVSIDWTVKESVKAKLRTIIKRILRKHGYPPDKQEKAARTVLEQAELLCGDIAA